LAICDTGTGDFIGNIAIASGGAAEIRTITTYLNDIYFGGDFDTITIYDFVDWFAEYPDPPTLPAIETITGCNNIAKISGGSTSVLNGGTDDVVRALTFNNDDLYVGGDFHTADGKAALHLAGRFTDFQDILDFVDRSRNSVLWGQIGGTLSDQTDLQTALNAKIAGTGVVGQVAEFVTDTKTLQAAKIIGPPTHIITITTTAAATLGLAITVGKTLTLTATDNSSITFTGACDLTIPTAGSVTAALLGTANVFTAKQTITGTVLTDQPGYDAEFLGAAGWTSINWTGDWASGWDHTTGNTSVLSQSTAAVVGVKYQISWTVTGRTDGTFTITFGGETYTGPSTNGVSATGTWGPTATTVGGLSITPTSLFDGAIVISIKAIISTAAALFILKDSSTTNRFETRTSFVANNVLIGINAGQYLTTATNSIGIGTDALSVNTTGFQDIAIGTNAMLSNTVGFQNIAIGVNALRTNTSGYWNNAIGVQAMYANTSGYHNTAFGYQALYTNTTGYYNVAMGYEALYLGTGGYQNSAIGVLSLANNTGYNQTALGFSAGRTLTGGNSNTFVGFNAGYNASQKVDAVNSMALGNGAYTTASNQVVIGDTNVTSVVLNGAVTIPNSANNLIIGTGAIGTDVWATFGNGRAMVGYSGTSLTTSSSGDVLIQGASGKGIVFAVNNTTWRSGTTALSILNTGEVVINEGGLAAGDFRAETDSYNAIFVDASNESIVIMSNAAGKVGFFAATAIVQPIATTDLGVVLSGLGLRAAGTAYPITTSGAVNLQGVTKLGDGATNYANFTAAGIQSFLGTARIAWTKKTAATATVTNMTTTSNVTDLQTANDGNAYTAVEVANNPNQNLVVGFTSITAFNWVQILGRYQGSSGHGITIQLEITPFDGSAWHTFGLLEDDTSDTNYINYSFFVPSDAAYINSGAVKVRFVHTMNGTAGHELVLDCVALYQ